MGQNLYNPIVNALWGGIVYMNGRLEVLFQSGLQFDGMMEGKWLVPDPCAVGGRLTVSGPS